MNVAFVLLLISSCTPVALASDDELLKELKARQEKVEALNSKNPFSADFGKIVQMSDESIKQAQELLERPAVQKMLTVASDPFVLKSLNQVSTHPKKKELIYWQIGWILLFTLTGPWRNSPARRWFLRPFFSLFNFLIFWCVSAVVIPWGVLWNFEWSWLREWGYFVARIFDP